jgi:hypothetical protein
MDKVHKPSNPKAKRYLINFKAHKVFILEIKEVFSLEIKRTQETNQYGGLSQGN